MSEGLANRLEEARQRLGLKQSEICASVGVPLRTYCRYESGENPPKVDALEGLGKLGIDIHWLITGEGQMMRGETPAPSVFNAPLDLPLLSVIIGMVEEWLGGHNRSLAPAKKAEVVATLYEIAIEETAKTGEARIEPRTVERFLRLVA